MSKLNVLISGASVAGPALAYWLTRYGHPVTVVERSPVLRVGGFEVDFRGTAHMTVLERMGILEDVRRRQTRMGEQFLLDADGKPTTNVPAALMSGEVEIERGDLSRILYDRTRDGAEYVFGDQITAIDDGPDGVDVAFANGRPRRFDLVFGADGLHSGVRSLVFGPDERFIEFLGYYVVGGITLPNFLDLDHSGVLYNVPGRLADVKSSHDRAVASAGFVFACEELLFDRHDVEAQKRIVADRYSDVGWEVPRMLEAMWQTQDIYFDSISQVHLDRYASGRVALVGDAAYGATLGGLGTGLAMVGAYLLAGELAVARGDHRIAFARYEEKIRRYAEGCQKLATNAGPFLAPPTEAKIRSRNRIYRLLSWRPMAGLFNKMSTRAANAITLPDYPELPAATDSPPAGSARVQPG